MATEQKTMDLKTIKFLFGLQKAALIGNLSQNENLLSTALERG